MATLPDCHSGKLPDCQTARLPYCQISNRPDCQTAKMSNCQNAILPDCHIARLPNCQIVKLPDCHIARHPDYHMATLILVPVPSTPFQPFSASVQPPSPLTRKIFTRRSSMNFHLKFQVSSDYSQCLKHRSRPRNLCVKTLLASPALKRSLLAGFHIRIAKRELQL